MKCMRKKSVLETENSANTEKKEAKKKQKPFGFKIAFAFGTFHNIVTCVYVWCSTNVRSTVIENRIQTIGYSSKLPK